MDFQNLELRNLVLRKEEENTTWPGPSPADASHPHHHTTGVDTTRRRPPPGSKETLTSALRDQQRRRQQLRARSRGEPLPPNSLLALNVRLLRSMFCSLSSFFGRSPKCLCAFSCCFSPYISFMCPSGLPLSSFFCFCCRYTSSRGKRKGSPCQQDGDGISRAGKIMRSSIPDLPEVT